MSIDNPRFDHSSPTDNAKLSLESIGSYLPDDVRVLLSAYDFPASLKRRKVRERNHLLKRTHDNTVLSEKESQALLIFANLIGEIVHELQKQRTPLKSDIEALAKLIDMIGSPKSQPAQMNLARKVLDYLHAHQVPVYAVRSQSRTTPGSFYLLPQPQKGQNTFQSLAAALIRPPPSQHTDSDDSSDQFVQAARVYQKASPPGRTCPRSRSKSQ